MAALLIKGGPRKGPKGNKKVLASAIAAGVKAELAAKAKEAEDDDAAEEAIVAMVDRALERREKKVRISPAGKTKKTTAGAVTGSKISILKKIIGRAKNRQEEDPAE